MCKIISHFEEVCEQETDIILKSVLQVSLDWIILNRFYDDRTKIIKTERTRWYYIGEK